MGALPAARGPCLTPAATNSSAPHLPASQHLPNPEPAAPSTRKGEVLRPRTRLISLKAGGGWGLLAVINNIDVFLGTVHAYIDASSNHIFKFPLSKPSI